MQKLLTHIGFILLFPLQVLSQNISPVFFGQNAWMPDTIGDINNCWRPPCVLNGRLHHNWEKVEASGVKLIRYGGRLINRNSSTPYQYLRIIDSVRKHHMEPLLQVQAWKKKIKPKEAAELVEFINKKQKRNVKYWSVGNEPDHDRCTVCDIASMVKSFSSAMKAVDSSIIIFAPELAHYDTSLLNPLLTPGNINDITGKDERGNYYVDVISVHSYPFDGSQSRDEVINKMPEIESRLTTLNERIENCNTYHKRWKNNALKLGLTEVNIAYKNNWPTGLTGTSANSFLGGQFWAEFTGAAMKHEVYTLCFFSIMEGEDANTNIGYLDGSTGMPKPTYYHLSLIANHFKGIYCDGKSKIPGVKVFGSKSEDEVSVAILNETDKDCAYLLYLNSSPVPDKSALNIEAGLNSRLQGSIPANSTQVLVFKNNASIIRKYEYRMKGEAEHNLPPTISVLPLLETDYRH